MSARIEWITDVGRFSALGERWVALTAGDESPFAEHAWLAAWWNAFGAAAQMRICTVWRNGQLVAALPLLLSRHRLQSLANDHTPSFRPLATDPESLRALIGEVVGSGVGEVYLQAIPESDPSLTVLAEASAGRRILHREPTHISPFVQTSGDLDAYEQRRVPGLKRTRQRRRRLEREHRVELLMEGGPESPLREGLELRLRRGFEVEATGWKRESGTAILSSPDTTRFYTSVAHAFEARGELRLAWLVVDDQPAAFTLCIERANRLYALKTGYDDAMANVAPGLVLGMYLVERCFERRLDSLELLGDAAPWKELLATGERRHVRCWSYRPRVVPLARYGFRRYGLPRLRALQELRARST